MFIHTYARLVFYFFPNNHVIQIIAVCVCTRCLQSCPTLCDPTDCSPPGSSVHGTIQARILELPFPPLGDLLGPGIELVSPVSPGLAGGFSTTEPPGKPSLMRDPEPKPPSKLLPDS